MIENDMLGMTGLGPLDNEPDPEFKKEMDMIKYANLETEVVLNIRKLVEDAMKRNPVMSSGAVLDLMIEQIQEDVLDGWSPDAE